MTKIIVTAESLDLISHFHIMKDTVFFDMVGLWQQIMMLVICPVCLIMCVCAACVQCDGREPETCSTEHSLKTTPPEENRYTKIFGSGDIWCIS